MAGRPLRVLPDEVAEAAYAACNEHHLDREDLARQVAASMHFLGPIRFQTFAELDRFVDHWAASHARLLASLAGLRHSWQRAAVDQLAQAFFLTGRLTALKEDLAHDRLYIPLDELDRAGVVIDQLRTGPADEAVRKLLWRQLVRVRDLYAQGRQLLKDLSGRRARVFKRWWLAGLELLGEIERRRYDLWSQPLGLSGVQRARVYIQALIGKAGFQ